MTKETKEQIPFDAVTSADKWKFN